MSKVFYLAAVLLVTSTGLFAGVPEIDPSTGGSALALLLGGLVVIRARRKK